MFLCPHWVPIPCCLDCSLSSNNLILSTITFSMLALFFVVVVFVTDLHTSVFFLFFSNLLLLKFALYILCLYFLVIAFVFIRYKAI